MLLVFSRHSSILGREWADHLPSLKSKLLWIIWVCTGGNGLLAGWLLVVVPRGRGCVKGTLLHCVPVSRDLVSFQNNAPAHMVTLMLYTCKIAFPSSRTVVLSLGCWTSVMTLVMKLMVLQMIDTMKPDVKKSLALSMMVAQVALPSSEIFHCDMIYTNPIFHVYFRVM